MSEAIIYVTVIVTAAALTYWWPTLRRKHMGWRRRRLAREAFDLFTANAKGVAQTTRDLTRAMRQASRDIDRASRILRDVEVERDDR